MPPSPAVDTPAPPSPERPSRVTGSSRTTWYVLGGAFVVALGLLWWRHHQQSAASSSATATGQGAATGSCTDANGNPVPCEEMAGIDYSGQLSTMQTELESLLAAEGSSTGTTTPPPSSGGTTTTTTAPTQAQTYKAPGSVKASKIGAGSMRVTWSLAGQPSPAPASYTIAAYQLNGKLAAEQTISVPDQTAGTSGGTISGLHSGWCYNVHVWANGGKTAPPHGTVNQVCV